MSNAFFERPILNSPYERPARHWELDKEGQPTQQIVDARRKADFVTPIPKPKKRKGKSKSQQEALILGDATGVGTRDQEYAATAATINQVRHLVGIWREVPNPASWGVTPETARLLTHWRTHAFSGARPFFCQLEAVETAIWLTEVAPQGGRTEKALLETLANANRDAKASIGNYLIDQAAFRTPGAKA